VTDRSTSPDPRSSARWWSSVVRGAPRTTLLHHLALLRGSGLVDLSVTAGEANVYRLRLEGFDQLAQAAKAFPLH